MNRRLERARAYFRKGLWEARPGERPRGRDAGIRALRMAVASVTNFRAHDGFRRSSALTFYSLLSVVPILALLLGVAKGFGFEDAIERQLHESMQGQEQMVRLLLQFALAMLDSTRTGAFAGAGVAILFWSAIRALGNLEEILNRIWGVARPRPPARRIVDYLAVSVLAPVLWISASTGTVVAGRYARAASENLYGAGWILPLLSPFLHLLPYCVIALALAFLYAFMPNRKVPWRSGAAAGVLAGAMYMAFQWIYISFQVGAARYNAVYGGFAALPLFLIWLNTSWAIVLFGAELSFAHANARTWEYAAEKETFSPWSQKALSLLVAREACLDFAAGKPPRTPERIAEHLDLPRNLTARLLADLARAGVVSPVCVVEGGPVAYQPARPLDQIRAGWVLARVEHLGDNDLSLVRPRDLSRVSEVLEAFARAASDAPENRPLHEI